MAARAAALVVHDLKNELGALEAALEQLALQPDPASAAAAHAQCRDLRQRLMSFLTVYGHEGELHAHCVDESPMELLSALHARGLRRAGGLQVTLDVSPDLPVIWFFDRRLVLMALEAALHNALRFARSHIWLGARTETGHLVFVVDDDGPGLGGADAADAGSTGLGTDLCRAVGMAHGMPSGDAAVRLLDRAEGGARFELWLAT